MPLDEYIDRRFREEILPVITGIFPLDYTTDPVHYILTPGRNRFRAVLPLVVAEVTGFDTEKAKIIGACAEIAWTGIIIHDDIIDYGLVRRGLPVAHRKFSLNSALCSGVLSLMRIPGILSAHGLENEVQDFCDAVNRTYKGQILHQEIRREADERKVLDIYRLKTSIGVWALTAATNGGGLREKIRAMSRFLGEAGQIKDDLDDLFVEGAYEPCMKDLQEGVYTLPFVLFYSLADRTDTARMDQYFGRRGEVPKDIVLGLLNKYGVIEHCKKLSRERIENAKKIIGQSDKSEGLMVLNEWITAHSVEGYK